MNLPRKVALTYSGRPVTAVVTGTGCDNHGSFVYRFTVAGQSYSGQPRASSLSTPCSGMRPGDSLLSYYLPSDPGVNEPGNVPSSLLNEVTGVLAAAILLPFFALLPLHLAEQRGTTPGRGGATVESIQESDSTMGGGTGRSGLSRTVGTRGQSHAFGGSADQPRHARDSRAGRSRHRPWRHRFLRHCERSAGPLGAPPFEAAEVTAGPQPRKSS